MSKHGTWTVIFDDNVIIKRTGEFDKATAKALVTGGTDFWNQSKFSNIHAIQFTNDNIDNDQVEFKDERLTTTDAKARLFEHGGYRALGKSRVDAVSAQLILESWMESHYGAEL